MGTGGGNARGGGSGRGGAKGGGGGASDPAAAQASIFSKISAGGDLTSIRDLRASMPGMSKEHFDAAVMALSRSGKVALHRHDYPKSLTQSQRDALVTNGKGDYFIGVMRR